MFAGPCCVFWGASLAQYRPTSSWPVQICAGRFALKLSRELLRATVHCTSCSATLQCPHIFPSQSSHCSWEPKRAVVNLVFFYFSSSWLANRKQFPAIVRRCDSQNSSRYSFLLYYLSVLRSAYSRGLFGRHSRPMATVHCTYPVLTHKFAFGRKKHQKNMCAGVRV